MRELAIIGDRFMLPSMFESAIRAKIGDALAIRSLEMPWPDEPMEHGYARAGMDGLKEYMGDPDEVVAFIGAAEIAVTQLAPFSAGMMDRMPGLKLIAVSRGGPVNIDMAAARARGIRVCNTPGPQCFGGRRIHHRRDPRRNAADHARARIAPPRRMAGRSLPCGHYRPELSELTVGVVGYGQVGSRVVRLLKAFGCRILVADPYVQLTPGDMEDGVEKASLEQILDEADVVTLHARVTKETTQFIGREQFARMKKGAFFVNTARGPLVDYEALTEALASGHLRGAAIETFGIEPVPADWPLLQLPNVTLTPHIAGASIKTIKIAAEAAAEEVRRYLAGEPPLNPC